MRLLLVDDDEPLMEALSSQLSDRRYAIDIATAGEMAWDFISMFTYDLVVLDRMLPDTDGVELCQKLRSHGHSMPILMLTARGDRTDVVEGLNVGADDYVVKPFDFEELVARIHALLRRNQEALPPVLQWGDLSLDPDTFEVRNGDRSLNLTPKEYAILELLLRNNNHVFTVDAIIDRIWTLDPPADSAVRTHIKCLRQKLKAAGVSKDMIETVYGIGYRLTTPPNSANARAADPPQENKAEPQAVKVVQKDTSAKMAKVLETFRVATNERIAVLQQASEALKTDKMSEELHQQAISSAHKLAGSLGTFGFPEGSAIAKKIEDYLKSKTVSEPVAKQQFYENFRVLQQAIKKDKSPTSTESAVSELPLLLIVGDDGEFTRSLVKEAADSQLSIAIATSFEQAKAVMDTDDPAICLLSLSSESENTSKNSDPTSEAQATQSKQFEMLERLHHQAPSLPIVAIAEPGDLAQRLDIIRRGGRTLLFQPIAPVEAIAAVIQLLKQTGAGARVLIVDDDSYVLKKIEISLAPWGLEISTLDDPHQFLTVLEQTKPDLLVLDIEMPDITGLELCQVLRSEPRWSQLPVVFLTAHRDDKTQQQAFAMGADDYIEKPILGADLANRLLNRLSRSRVRQQ